MATPISQKNLVKSGKMTLVYQPSRRNQELPAEWSVTTAAGNLVRKSWESTGRAIQKSMMHYSGK